MTKQTRTTLEFTKGFTPEMTKYLEVFGAKRPNDAKVTAGFPFSVQGGIHNMAATRFVRSSDEWEIEGNNQEGKPVRYFVRLLCPPIDDAEKARREADLQQRILGSTVDRAAINLTRRASEAVQRLENLANNQRSYLNNLLQETGNEPTLEQIAQFQERMLNDLLWGVANMNLPHSIGAIYDGAKAEGKLAGTNS
jgi:hypothetical protein